MHSKKKTSSCLNLERSRKICGQNNIKIYQINKNGTWYIEVSVNGTIKTFSKSVGVGSVLDSKKQEKGNSWVKAVEKTTIYYAEKVL